MGARIIIMTLALGCGGAHNSDFGSPQDASSTLNGKPLDCSLSDATCPGGGDCCGTLCCAVNQTCCAINGNPTCVTPESLNDPCSGPPPFSP